MKRKLIYGVFAIVGIIACISMVGKVSANKETADKSQNLIAPLLVEDFTYADGALLANNNWTAHSGAGTNPLATSPPGLTFAGYPSSGVGNAVSMTVTGEDAHRVFTPQTSGTVYVGVLANFSEAAIDAAGIGGYFFHLGGDPIGSTFRGRIYVQKNASNALAFGITKASTSVAGDISFTPFNYALNTTYLFVVKYTVVDGATNDTVSLTVNTTTPANEPAPTVSAPDVGASDIIPSSVALRQGTASTAPTQRVDGIRVGTTWADIVSQSVAPVQNVLDFDGNGRTDFALVRNVGSGGGGAVDQARWFINLNGPATTSQTDFGRFTIDSFVPADYDGDNKTDIAVWRGVSTGNPSGNAFFYILQSETNTVRTVDFGQIGDDPRVVGDYDGDGKDDVAVYRRGANNGDQSVWYYRGSLNNPSGNITYAPWGQNTGGAQDRPVPGDFDGDGRNDFVILRNNAGAANFWFRQSTAGIKVQAFGLTSDFVVPGDYDGDSKTDIAVARRNGIPGSISWFISQSSNGATVYVDFGASTASVLDLPVQGDYDGDGKTDVAIWRPSTTPGASAFWYRGSQSGNASTVSFGVSTDYPVAIVGTY